MADRPVTRLSLSKRVHSQASPSHSNVNSGEMKHRTILGGFIAVLESLRTKLRTMSAVERWPACRLLGLGLGLLHLLFLCGFVEEAPERAVVQARVRSGRSPCAGCRRVPRSRALRLLWPPPASRGRCRVRQDQLVGSERPCPSGSSGRGTSARRLNRGGKGRPSS